MTIKHLLEHKNLWLALAGLWTVFIAYMCLASFKSLPVLKISNPDKYVHITFYLVFTILWACHLNTKKKDNTSLVKVVSAAVVYGIIIEIAQGLFTTTRNADIMDVFANTLGAIIGAGIMLIAARLSTQKI